MLPFDTVGAWFCRAGAPAVVVGLAISGCGATPQPAWWDDGTGGSKSVALLTRLDADGRNCSALVAESMDCEFSSGRVSIYARRTFDAVVGSDLLMVVDFDGMMPGTQATTETGYRERFVGIAHAGCFMGESTYRAPKPCEVELQGIQRGERQELSTGSGGAPGVTVVEVGSRVRLRVSCPDGLYHPGSDDVNAFYVPLVPSEFALEAQDCVVVDE